MTTTVGDSGNIVSAARLVGRVGSLAVVLGVGAGMFTGLAVACAETGDSDSSSSAGANAQSSQGGSDSASGNSSRARRAGAAGPRGSSVNDAPPAQAAGDDTTPITSVRASTVRSARTVEAPTESAPAAAAAAAPAATSNTGNSAPPTAAAPTAAAQASATGSSVNTITVDPTIAWGGEFKGKAYPGIIVGSLNATSPLPLKYTTISQPSLGGKLGAHISGSPANTVYGDQGSFFYIPDAGALATPGKTESFKIMVSQVTDFDRALASLPIIGLFASSILTALHRTPILGNLLAPIIGASQIVTFDADPYALATDPMTPGKQRATAFTTKVESFDGLMVATNYFPAVDVALGLVDSAPTILNGPGLGAAGNTDLSNPYGQLTLFPWDPPTPRQEQVGSLTPGLPVLRSGAWISPDGGPDYTSTGGGYNVITWDPRGEWATRDKSLPGMQIDNPFFEGRDASALISWAFSNANLAQSQVAMESPGDPLIGMVGGSYGGGIQWVTAGTDPRVDVIAPEISWSGLISALYPNYNQFKTGWGSILGLALLVTGADFNKQLYPGILTGITLGWLSETSQAVMESSGPTSLLNNINIPTLIFQGQQDGLFPLLESVNNATHLINSQYSPETKLSWFCGGHGTCQDPLNPYQDDRGMVDNLRWLDQYLFGNGTPADAIPTFQWYDQTGGYGFSDLLPSQPGFNKPLPHTTTGDGGVLGVWPLIGGSGPGTDPNLSKLLTFPNATTARNALNLTITPPANSLTVGSPELSFTYRGIGTTRTVYAQLVDNVTGRVLQNIVTPIPVEFDGKEHSLTIPMADIAYSAGTNGSLTLQITSSATNFENFTSFGLVKITDVKLDMPIKA